MAQRKATAKEQNLIDKCNEILREADLTVTELTDKGGGAVIPNKGF